VVACGALSSALLLLRAASDAHPRGLANGSDQVGRNYMRHNMSVLMALLREPNDTVFQKTVAVSDYYFGSADWEYPMGLIQMCATSHGEQIRGESLPSWLSWTPEWPFEKMAQHSISFWLQSEDLPRPENRIFYDGDKVVLDMTGGKEEAAQRLKGKLKSLLEPMGAHKHLFERRLYLGKDIPINGTAHQAGTCRFGTDSASSVLNLDCRAHEVDNLYVTDASFFPSIGAGGEDAFFDQVRERLEPIWRRFPHVQDVRVLRTKEADPGAIPIVMVLEMDFLDLGSIHASLASAIKTEAHEATLEVLKPFSGRFFHFIAESRPLGAGSKG